MAMDTQRKELAKNNLRESNSTLITEVDELTEEIKKQNSRPRIFFDGIIRGLGYAVGATILFGILIAILGFIVSKSDATWVENLVDWLGLDQYLNN